MFTSTTSSVLVRPHVLIHVGEVTVFSDRIDGITDCKRVGNSSPPNAEFHILMSSGEMIRVWNDEKLVAADYARLKCILEAQQDDLPVEDDDHPQGQSG